ncbi:alpha/beta hydrolase fold-containing protein [Oscillochloris trichoides DG-6]|uniref:Alpha/beta hydrolase fold-containing protein n=1 Tax=Oscillochloris trichoides DG-6 TaxID=765420 RepID=E1IBM0_9CHLR|nr:alpha/beta fold hydrolase [Oscillochloris trichoides]EFO81439.1 alpha/beta hydrolase fold-containing protein [Oscillochloris trichoides DG-6]
MSPRTNLLPFLTTAALGTFGTIVGTAWYVTTRVSPQHRRDYRDEYTFTPWELGVPYETIHLRSADGLALRGWWLPQPGAKEVVIGSHGHSGRKDDLLGIGTSAWRAGFNVLLFDYRGRGDSEPWPHTLISREVDDLRAAVAYAQTRVEGAKIGVVGFSMGAAVAIMAAAQEPGIAALVADSSFTSVADVVAHQVRRSMGLMPPAPIIHTADMMLERRHGYRFTQARPIDAIAQLGTRPILIIHGANDSTVPVAQAERLFAAAPQPKQLWVVEGVEHCGGYFADRPTYCERVTRFFVDALRSEA